MNARGVISIAFAAVLLTAPASAQSVKAGVEAWQRADYATAVTIWRPLAEGGDSDAMFNLGQAYRLGRGVATDLTAAQTWFEQAALKGHLDAQTTLGLLLFNNGNRAEGLRWFRSAAERGDPRAQLIYGTALFNGDHVTRDATLGYTYVSRAAAQGLGAAKATLEEMDKILPIEQRKKGAAMALAEAIPPEATAESPKKPIERASPSPVTPTGTWRVQLGAFSKPSSAEALFKRLSAGGALKGRRSFLVPVGAVTRLQAGPFESRAAAAKTCSLLAAGGQACFPVPAK